MNKIGYLLLAVLNCSLVFGVALPAEGPLSTDEISLRVDAFIKDKDVGRCTIDWRNRICSIVDNPFTVTGCSAFGITSVAAISEIVKQCNVTDVACIANQLSFNGVVASAILSVPLLSMMTWTWDLKHKSVRNAPNVKRELKNMIKSVLLNPERTTRTAAWILTHNNLDSFLQFALAEYWSAYRASSKFEKASFEFALANWKP